MTKPCTLPPAKHSHSQDRRYCYWRHNSGPWVVRDRVTLRTIACRTRRAVGVWIKAAQAFAPSFEAKPNADPCS